MHPNARKTYPLDARSMRGKSTKQKLKPSGTDGLGFCFSALRCFSLAGVSFVISTPVILDGGYNYAIALFKRGQRVCAYACKNKGVARAEAGKRRRSQKQAIDKYGLRWLASSVRRRLSRGQEPGAKRPRKPASKAATKRRNFQAR